MESSGDGTPLGKPPRDPAEISELESRNFEDVALARSVAKGDRVASERFARRLLPTVRLVSRQLLRGSEDAKDAVQNSLIELLNSAFNYAGRGSLEAWARRITTRSTLRLMKKSRAHERKLAQAHESSDKRTYDSMHTEVLDRLPRPIDEYLDKLSDVQRTAVVLRFVLGHTIPEIAEMTDTPIPTAKSRIQKGHQELRRLVRRDLNLGVRRDEEDDD